MRVVATAPNRVDLAGGTLDLYPLYLLEDGGITVNAALSLTSRTEATLRRDGRVRVRSLDTGLELAADGYDELPLGGPLDLAVRALRHFRPAGGCDVVTANEAPRGSGLGASSALLVTLCAALSALTGEPLGPERLVRVAADLEAQVIGVPTGRQDYYAAVEGGVNALWFEVARDRVERLDADGTLAAELGRRLVVGYVGEPHRSGQPNWRALRSYVEGRRRTRAALRAIKQAALGMRAALLAGPDWDAAARWLREDGRQRQRLARGVVTERTREALEAALAAGAAGAKVCGAGGGGSVVALAEPGARDEVVHALSARGITVLPVAVDVHGLSVRLET